MKLGDLQPGERAGSLGPSGNLSLHVPGDVGSGNPIVLARPPHGLKQIDTTNIVADEILISRID